MDFSELLEFIGSNQNAGEAQQAAHTAIVRLHKQRCGPSDPPSIGTGDQKTPPGS